MRESFFQTNDLQFAVLNTALAMEGAFAFEFFKIRSKMLHLCHEIKAGNGDRLNEVAANIKPWLRLPSINGADVDAVNEAEGWKRGIQPLTMGDYDSSQLLDALKSVDYEGPVILHTWGLQKAAADHHHTSYKRFQEMVDAL